MASRPGRSTSARSDYELIALHAQPLQKEHYYIGLDTTSDTHVPDRRDLNLPR